MTDESTRSRRESHLLAPLVGAWLGGLFGALLAWFMVDWPHPLPVLFIRVLGWAFFVSLGVVGGLMLGSVK